MMTNKLMDQKSFWKLMETLLSLQTPKSLDRLCRENEVGSAVINSAIIFLSELGHQIKVEKKEGNWVITPPKEKVEIRWDLSLFDWLQLQSLFPYWQEFLNKPEYGPLKLKVDEMKGRYKHFDFFQSLKKFEINQVALTKESGEMYLLNVIENLIVNKSLAEIHFKEKQKVWHKFYPRKLVYLEGKLTVVGEDPSNHCLESIEADRLDDIRPFDEEYVSLFSAKEIDDFVSSVRCVSGNELRLVLKINSRDNIDLLPKHHYLGNPCMVVNNEGDLIWAATVEPSDALFEWLFQQKRQVEILDPQSFKNQFEDYCANKKSQNKVA